MLPSLFAICHLSSAHLSYSLSVFPRLNVMQRILAFAAIVVCPLGPEIQAQEPANREIAKHQGTWLASSFRRDGQETPQDIVRTITRTVVKDHVVWKRNGKSFAGTAMVLDPKQSPKAIDVIADGGPTRGKRVLGIIASKRSSHDLHGRRRPAPAQRFHGRERLSSNAHDLHPSGLRSQELISVEAR